MIAKVSRRKNLLASFFVLVFAAWLSVSPLSTSAVVPYVTEIVNLQPGGSQMTVDMEPRHLQISQDGRYVAFWTLSTQLMAGDTNGRYDIYVRDRKLGTNVRATVSSTGVQLTDSVLDQFSLSGNGRYLVFSTPGSNVVPGDTNGSNDVFVRDLVNNTTERVSISSAGTQANIGSSDVDTSADGRYVVFRSAASNLVSGDTNNKDDVFVRDRKLGTTTLLSKNTTGDEGNNESFAPSISCDGTYVSFVSKATDLVASDTNGYYDLFLLDRINNNIKNITAGGNYYTTSKGNELSCNGSTLIYLSNASNLVAGDTNGTYDIFAYDVENETTQRVNVDSSGNQTTYVTNPGDSFAGGVDFSGRYVVFEGLWDDLVSGDTNGKVDVFIRDLQEGTTQIVSKRSAGVQSTESSSYPSITLDGREVLYMSSDTGLVSGDTNGRRDIFVSKTGV